MNRAERRVNNERVIRNRLKELKDLGDNSRHKYLATKSNKLSKTNALSCGNPKCGCKTEKIFSTKDNKGNKRRDNIYKGDVTDE